MDFFGIHCFPVAKVLVQFGGIDSSSMTDNVASIAGFETLIAMGVRTISGVPETSEHGIQYGDLPGST